MSEVFSSTKQATGFEILPVAMNEPAPKPAPKKKGRKPKLDPELVAGAIVAHCGNLKSVARQFKVQRASVQELVSKRPALQSLLLDAREGMLDDAESSLYKAVKKGEAWAVCFFLKTQGKARGYIERSDPDAGKPAPAPLVVGGEASPDSL